MTLPAAEHAIIDEAKLRDYLLSSAHPIGRFNAVFFAALGYEAEAWKRLRADLLAHAARDEAQAVTSGGFGQKYEVRGTLEGPRGRSAQIVSVWIVLEGEDHPRFVTAYPGTAR